MVCIEKRPHILYGRSSAPHFRYLTCLLDRGHITADSKKGTIPKSGEETLDAFVDVSTGGMLCDYIFLHTDDRSNPCIQAVSV